MLYATKFTPSLYQVISERDPTASDYEEYKWQASGASDELTVDWSGTFGSRVNNCISAGGDMLTLDLQHAGPFTAP
jgi:hypothetical protein